MFPTINKKETGVNLRRIMDMRGVKPKDIQEYLGLGCVQSVYRCRHTFCSNMAKSGMNPKMLQYIIYKQFDTRNYKEKKKYEYIFNFI